MSKRKTDSPRKRMRDVIYRGAKGKILRSNYNADDVGSDYWQQDAKAFLTVDPRPPLESAWFPETGWTKLAAPLQEKFAKLDEPFLRARRRLFAHFGLNPYDPHSWRILVDYFAYAEFYEHPKRERGRPQVWTTQREAELAKAVATLPSQSQSAAAAARLLAKSPLNKNGRSSTGSALRRQIAKVKKAAPKTGT